jgi:HSP20 family molecular chaperone IbpA
MIEEERMDIEFGFPKRLWRRPIEFHEGKPRFRVAASSYSQDAPSRMFGDETSHVDLNDRDEVDQSEKEFAAPRVRISTEEGNARVTVELSSVDKKDMNLHCAEDSLTLSVKTPSGSWIKEIPLPFRVDPDTARAAFRNGKLELTVRKHSKFNPPRPKIDWV